MGIWRLSKDSMRIGETVLYRVKDLDDFRGFIDEIGVDGEGYVIKPNWGSASIYTRAETLKLFFEGLKGEKVVIEGYTAWRNSLNTGPDPVNVITSRNAKAMWEWIREQDRWFLEYAGVKELLERYHVEYVNVTEEVWSDRIADPRTIRELVEEKFRPVKREEIYSFIPKRIFDLRDHTLISLNKSRRTIEVASLSIKNLFGLIPDPSRLAKWHGKGDRHLAQSIIDINKVYRSLFKEILWINEVEELNLFIGGRNSVEADSITAKILGLNPEIIGYLSLAEEIFGGYDKKVLERIPAEFNQDL